MMIRRRKSAAPEQEAERYHGFRLTNSRRDRAIAAWLAEHKRQAGSIIKELLYQYITNGNNVLPVMAAFEDEDAAGDEGAAAGALRGFED